jgi:hypothetical protein
MHLVGDDLRASWTEDTTRDGRGVVGAQGSRGRFDNQGAPARMMTLAC